MANFRTRFWERASKYYKLKPAYKIVSTVVVLLGGSLGLFFWTFFAGELRTVLGIPLEGGSLDGIMGPFLIWVLGVLIAIPLALIPCFVFAALIVGILFWVIRRISFREALDFALVGKYPASWF
jgi:hypothetical protein